MAEEKNEQELLQRMAEYSKMVRELPKEERALSTMQAKVEKLKKQTLMTEGFLRRELPNVSDPHTNIPRVQLYTFHSFTDNPQGAYPKVNQFLNELEKLEGNKFLVYSFGSEDAKRRSDRFLLGRLTPPGYEFEGRSSLFPKTENLYKYEPYKGFSELNDEGVNFNKWRLELTSFLEEIIKNGEPEKDKPKIFSKMLSAIDGEYEEIPGFQVTTYDDKPKQGNAGGIVMEEYMIPATGAPQDYLVVGDKRVDEFFNQYRETFKNKKSREKFESEIPKS